MALNLIKAGHSLRINDLRREAARNLEDAGAVWVSHPEDVARDARAVLLSLPMPNDVEQVMNEGDGVLAGLERGGTVIDLSTNSPTAVRRLAELSSSHGISFLDAPVSGGVRGARKGTLAIMVGGEKPVFDTFRPVLQVMGTNVFHIGEVGAGNVAKLVNNMLAFIHMMGSAEALIMGAKAGVDPNILWKVVKASSGNSFVWESGTRAILRDRLAPTFTIDLACKDMGLANDLGAELGVPLKMAGAAHDLLKHYQATGFAREDVLATISALESEVHTLVRGTWQE